MTMAPAAALLAHEVTTGDEAVLMAVLGGTKVHVYAGPIRDGVWAARDWGAVCGAHSLRMRLPGAGANLPLCGGCDRLALRRIISGLAKTRTLKLLDRWVLVISLTGDAARRVQHGIETVPLHQLVAEARQRINAAGTA